MPRLISCGCEAMDCVCTNLMPSDEFDCDECSLGNHTYPWDDDELDGSIDVMEIDGDWLDG